MGIDCGSQLVLCDLPVRIDTYKGCSHGCKYCFVQNKTDISELGTSNCIKQLKSFIEGKRTQTTSWCDWAIPLHWGGMSDPFQPIEAKYQISYECLKIFAETKYPFIVSTKGRLLATDKYLDLLKQCNAVVQLSMVCSKYDKIEPGCPSYEERLQMARKIAPNCRRLIVRLQPYMTEVFRDVMNNLPRLKQAGVYGVTIEGMKFFKKKEGLIKLGHDYCYPTEVLKKHFQTIKDECHRLGLKFYCAENRLRTMGDDMCCCGIDGLEGFRGNKYHLLRLYNNCAEEPTGAMKVKNTAQPFRTLYQSAGITKFLAKYSFEEIMTDLYKKGKDKNTFTDNSK